MNTEATILLNHYCRQAWQSNNWARAGFTFKDDDMGDFGRGILISELLGKDGPNPTGRWEMGLPLQ